jgi:predicted dienelactone hydrolase
MNNLLKIAHHIPVAAEVPVISVSPVSLPAPDRGMELEVRISAPVTGTNLPVILFSHGHGPSLYIPSADGYGPIVNFWAAHGYVVIQPTHLNAKARGMAADAPGGPTFWKTRVTDMKQIIEQLDQIIASVPGLAGRVDTSKIAVAGHSLGGQTAGMLLGARAFDPNDPDASDVDMSDPRIMAGILMAAPGNGGSDLAEGAANNPGYSFMNPDFSHMTTLALVVRGDKDVNPRLTTRGADWHADPYTRSPGPKWLLTLTNGEHSLGGVSGFDAKETTDENPDRLEVVARMTSAWLRTIFDRADPAWTDAVTALDENASSLGHVESK